MEFLKWKRLKERSIEIWKHELFYKEFGKKKNLALLILHGWWWSSDSWVQFSEQLEDNYYIIVPDLPGFGKTEMKDIFTLERYAKLIEEFTSELRLKDIFLMWHSNGWAIAIVTKSRKNIEIQRLILNNSAGIRRDTKRGIKRKILWTLSFLKHVPWYKKIRPYFHRAIGAQDYAKAEKNPYLSETYQNMIQSDLQDLYPKIEGEVVLIWWENDGYTPLSDGKKIESLLPNAKMIILSGEKHGIHLQNPKRLVDTFLDQVR